VTEPRRILIAGINYQPEKSGIAPYTTELAEHLVRQGHEVVVLTAMPSYPAWKVFEEYRGALRHRRVEHGVEVRRFRHYLPARQSAVLRAGYEFTYLAHALSHGPLGRAPDLVLGVVPSLGGGVLAKLEAARYRRPYGLIVQDLMGPATTQSGISGGSAVAGATRFVEGWVARGAAGVAVISEGFRGYLERLGVNPDRIVHLPNWSHLRPVTESREQSRSRMGWLPGEQIVLHTGNMGLKQGLENLLEVARRAAIESPRSRFILLGDGNQRPTLENMARSIARVEFLDLVDDDVYPNVLAAADVLVVNERAGVADMSLPSKLTSYFAAGRAVVVAVPSGSATALEAVRAKAALVVPAEDPGAFVAALLRLANHPDLATQLAANGVRYAADELTPAACLARADAFIETMIPAAVSAQPNP